ncbi:hypothetical protein [Shewanella sp.]|uniref:hypothetical protein n=1 Tax=Shewanella sp. TaxID=50422 RepID=UPI003A96A085
MSQQQVKRVLFIPVSSPEGIGEYTRSLILAQRLANDADIHFILNRHASYSASCPFPMTLLDCSPTKDITGVNQVISNFRPDVVVFDASGRHQQLQHAKRLGAKVVFLSQHKRKRNRGMRIRRARYTDVHLVVQPHYLLPPIPWWRRQLLNHFGHSHPQYVGAIFDEPDVEHQARLLASMDLTAGNYLLFSAGSGAHQLHDELAVELLWREALLCQQQLNMPCVVVFGSNYPGVIPPSTAEVKSVAQLPTQHFVELLSGARAAVLSGGDTLIQAIALQVPSLAIAVSKDQPQRITACAQRGLVLAAQTGELVPQVHHLLMAETRQQLLRAMADEPQQAGLAAALVEIRQLLSR